MDSHVRLSPLTGRTPAVSRESPAVREESQLDEMRSAILGDFERLAERRGEQVLLHVSEPEPPSPEVEQRMLWLECPSEIEPPRRSWLSRLISS